MNGDLVHRAEKPRSASHRSAVGLAPVALFVVAVLLVSVAATVTPVAAAPAGAGSVTLEPAAAGEAPSATAPSAVAPRGFEPVEPARLLDTRPDSLTIDDRFAGEGPVLAGETVELEVTGRGDVPVDGVGAVALNVTGTSATEQTHLTVSPTGSERPLASSLNVAPGQTVANMVIASVGDDGSIDVFNNSGSIDVLVDVAGWFAVGSDYTGLVPARSGTPEPTARRWTATSRRRGRSVRARCSHCRSPAVVVSRAMASMPSRSNITALHSTGSTHLTVWPAGAPRPLASTLNLDADAVVPNLVIAKVGTGGSVSVFNNSGSVDVVVDVVGFVLDPTPEDAADRVLSDPPVRPAHLTSLSPARVADTRPGNPTIDGRFEGAGPVGAAETYTVDVLGRGGVPAHGAGIAVFNVTATGATDHTHLTMHAAGTERPLASNLNARPGLTVANLVAVELGEAGGVSVFNNSGSVDVIIDVVAWLPVATNQMDPSTIVADTTQVTPQAIDREGESTIAWLTTPVPTVGTVVVLVLDDGPLYGRVTAVDGNTVATEPASLMDVFPQLDLHVQANELGETQALTSTGDAVDATIHTSDPAPPIDVASDGDDGEGPCQGSVSAAMDVDVDAGMGDFDFVAEWGWFGPSRLSVGYNPHFGVDATAVVTASGSCEFDYPLFERDLPTIILVIGIVPVVFTQSIAATATGNVEAEAAVTLRAGFNAGGALGVNWNDTDGFALVNEVSGESTLDPPTVEVVADAAIDIPVTYGVRAYGILGFDGSVGPFSELHVAPEEDPYLTLDAGLTGHIDAVFELQAGPIDWSESTTFGPMEFARWRLLELGPPKIHVEAGLNHTCAVLADDTAKCWGQNVFGQLGDATTTNSGTPVAVAGLGDIAQIAPGNGHTCAVLRDETVKCWGFNQFGALGDGTTESSLTPVTVEDVIPEPPPGEDPPTIVSLSANEATCALLSDGVIRCWGHGNVNGTSPSHVLSPATVTGIGPATELDMFGEVGCAVLEDTTAVCWGENDTAQLGDGSQTTRATPAPVTGLTGVAHIAPGLVHSCASMLDGTARCWGFDHLGGLGDGPTDYEDRIKTEPVLVTELTDVAELHSGAYFSCARLHDKSISCWGADTLFTGRDVPTPFVGVPSASQLSLGAYHECAVVSTEAIKCWGYNIFGQLGNGVIAPGTTPLSTVIPIVDVIDL